MSKQLLIVVALCASLACAGFQSAAAADQSQQPAEYFPQYAGPEEQPIGLQQPLADYDAPAVQPGQVQPGEVRHSVAGHMKSLANVVGQGGKRILQDAQPVLLGLKSDLAKTKDRIRLSPGVVRVKDALPSVESIKQATAPLVDRSQEKLGKFLTGIKNRRHRYNTRHQQKLQQQEEQEQQQQQQQYLAAEPQQEQAYQQNY